MTSRLEIFVTGFLMVAAVSVAVAIGLRLQEKSADEMRAVHVAGIEAGKRNLPPEACPFSPLRWNEQEPDFRQMWLKGWAMGREQATEETGK